MPVSLVFHAQTCRTVLTDLFGQLHLPSRLVFALMLLCISVAGASNAFAQTLTWTGAGDGVTFGSAANWSPAVVPGPTHDCIIPAGGAQLKPTANVSVRSLATARNFLLTNCVILTVTNGISLAEGAVLTVDNVSTCGAIVFSGGVQKLAGNGEIRLTRAGTNGAFVALQNNASVSIENGITISFVSLNSATRGARVTIEAGSALVNGGTISTVSGGMLTITGLGAFSSPGTLQATNARLTVSNLIGIVGELNFSQSAVVSLTGSYILSEPVSVLNSNVTFAGQWSSAMSISAVSSTISYAGTWSNTGGIILTNSNWALSGVYSEFGPITRVGGVITLGGNFTGPILSASAATGNLDIGDLTLSGTLIRSTDGARLSIVQESRFNACTLDTELQIGCSSITISGGLIFTSTGKLTSTGGCGLPMLVFSGEDQTVSGPGTISYVAARSSQNAFARVTQGTASLENDLVIKVGPATGTPTALSRSSVTIDSGAKLINRTQLDVLSGMNLVVEGAGAFENQGGISAQSGAAASIQSSPWSNSGTITAENADLAFGGSFAALGSVVRVGGTLTLSGTFIGSSLEATSATGDFMLLNFAASNALLTAAPGQQFFTTGPLTLNACTIGGRLALQHCSDTTITGGLGLANGVITVGPTGFCSPYDGLVFRGGLQQMTGSGSIALEPGSSTSSLMRLRDGVELTIGPGITVGPGALIRQATVTVDTGCTLKNLGTIAATSLGQSVVLKGAGTFTNQSLVDAGSGSVSILTASWVNDGVFRVADSGTLNFGGTYSSFGTIERTGGSIVLSGAFTGSALHASAATGDITLNSGTFLNVTFTSADDAMFRSSGEVTLDGCSLSAGLTLSCSTVTVRHGLTLSGAGAVNVGNPDGSCNGSLTFDGKQAVEGTGQFSLYSSGGNAALFRINVDSVVTFDTGITVRWSSDPSPSSSFPTSYIFIGNNSSLINRGTIAIQQSNRVLSFSGGATSTLLNEGTLEAAAGTLAIDGLPWTNTGVLSLSGSATLRLGGLYSSIPGLVRSGGTLVLGGTYSGTSLNVGPSTGDLTLSLAKLTGTTISVQPGFQLTTANTVEFNGCTIASDLNIGICSTLTISNGLTLNGTVLTFGAQNGCGLNGASLEFASGTQTITGIGELRLNAVLVNVSGILTLGPGVLMSSGPDTTNLPTTLTVKSAAKLTNLGTIVGNTNALFKIAGPFVNQGMISVLSGTLELTALSGSAGALSLAPAASLILGGNYSLDNPLDVASGRSLSLSGTWTNNTQITANGAAISLLGTWINNGSFNLSGSTLTLGGTYSSLGNFTTSSTQLTYSGTIKTAVLNADASTGDVILKSVNLTSVTLQSSGGAKFRLTNSTGSSLSACVIAGDVVLGTCANLNISNGLSLVNGAEILIDSDNGICSSGAITFFGPAQAVSGIGTIRIRNFVSNAIGFSGPTTVTLAPGISTIFDAATTTGVTSFAIPTGSSLINQGLLSIEVPAGQLSITGTGTFINQGTVLTAPWSSLSITCLSGALGMVTLGSNASLVLAGNYAISDPLSLGSGSSLSLTGTWVNNSSLSVSGGTLVLGGTWSNAGSMNVTNSAWTIGGTYSTLGNVTASSNRLTYAGTFPGPILEANASTGDITLSTLTLNNTTLRTRDNARINIGLGSAVTMSQCSIETDLRFTYCSTLSINKGLALADGITLTFDNPFCNRPALTFTGTTQSVTGRAKLAILDAGSANAITLSTSTNSVVTLGSDLELAFGPTPAGSAAPLSNFTISLGTGRTLLNQGLIASRLAGKTLTISTGTFQNNGTVESAAGSINITSTLANYLANVSRLTGGRWIMSGGSLTFGTSVINSIGAGTEFRIQSASGTSPSFASFGENLGTFAIASGTLSTTPVGGTFSNAGTLELGPAANMRINGSLAFDPASTLRIPIAGLAQPALGQLAATGPITLAGKLAAAFTPPFAPQSGDITATILSSPSILGAFAATCADGNPASLGVQPLLDSVSAPNNLALLITASGGLSPFITQQPADTSATPNATFSCAASPADSSFRWFKDGVPLVDGPTAHGSVISGAFSSSLAIAGTTSSDSGLYTCSATNSCGTSLSNPARLSVCPGDFNADGLVDDSDFQLFVASYTLLDCADPSMPPACPADLDRSGAVDDGDFPIFIISYDALLCP